MRDPASDEPKVEVKPVKSRPAKKRRSYGYRVDVIKGIEKSRILVTK
jgi:hypothetical protein